MNPTKIAIVVIVVVVIAGAAYLFSTQNPASAPEGTQMESTEQTVDETMVEDDENSDVVVIDMTGEDFSFDPSEITVKTGQRVKVVLTAGDMQHDFVIDELDVKSEIAVEGETVEVEFTPTEAGEFEYYCSVGEHRANGMVGTLTVTE